MNEIPNKMTLLTLKGHDSFKRVFDKGKKVYRNDAMLVYNRKISIGDIVYYGVSIGKKNAKKAVIRNRIRRLIRESIRMYIKEVGDILQFEHFVIIWRKAPKMQSLVSLNDIKPIVFEMLNEAISRLTK